MQAGGKKFADKHLLHKLKKSDSLCKATINNPRGPDDPHTNGILMLHLACQEGLIKCVKYLNKKIPQQIGELSAAAWTPLM